MGKLPGSPGPARGTPADRITQKLRISRMRVKPWSNEIDFSQYNMQHLPSGKSRDRLTTFFTHVETCRNMLYVVEGSLIGIKNVASTNVLQQYISFVSEVRA